VFNLTQFTVAQGNPPSWINLYFPENEVFFIGKSEPAVNFENYQEAKAGALMDILTQFAMYKGVSVRNMLYNWVNTEGNGDSIIEITTRITFSVNSLGLFQTDEWMAYDGTLYLLYHLLPDRQNPTKYLFNESYSSYKPELFQDYYLMDDRIYFTSMFVTTLSEQPDLEIKGDSIKELMEQNAKIQALLWLGADIMGILTYYSSENNKTEFAELLTGTIKSTSKINLQNHSFREEAYHSQTENGRIYYYRLYSINAAEPVNTTEYEFFTYMIEYITYISLSDEETHFSKNINLNGYQIIRDHPYNAGNIINTSGKSLQTIIGEIFLPSRNELHGIGIAKNTSREIINQCAAIFAVTDLAQQIGTLVAQMLDDYLSETGTTSQSELLAESYSHNRSLFNVTISHCIKLRDEFSDDGYLVQVWIVPKQNVLSVFNEALEQQMRRTFEQ
jgi:hypothetical protein